MLVSGHLTFDLNSKLFLPGMSIVEGFRFCSVVVGGEGLVDNSK